MSTTRVAADARETALETPPRPTVLLSCGEASGDLYAAELLRELRRLAPETAAFGLGGPRLAAAGAELVVRLEDVSVIGLVEVLGKLAALRRARDRLLAEAARRRPDVAVLVDFSGFNLRLARRLRRRGTRIVYYVSPQVWAWRRGRVRTIRRLVDRMLVILPFEEPLYRAAGVPVRFVGHPLVDLVRPRADGAVLRRRLGLAPNGPVLALLPGSRPREIELHTPVLAGAVERIAERRADVAFVLAKADTVGRDAVASRLGPSAARVRIVEGATADVLAAADAAVVASGTATVEAALCRTPMVVVYRVGRWSYRLGRPFVRVPHYAMVNLIAGRAVVPELIQDAMTEASIAEAALGLLEDEGAAEAMRRALDEVRARLGGGGASRRAAEEVLEAALGCNAAHKTSDGAVR